MPTPLAKIAQESIASQDWFELWQLLVLLNENPPRHILEIGVHRGGMLETLLRAFGPVKLVGVDLDYSDLEFRNFNAIAGNSRDPEIRNQAVEAAGGFGSIDFVFVDGDHGFDAVMSDYELYSPAVRAGGIMAFHDIMRDPDNVPHHRGVDCRKAFDVIKKRHASIEIWNGTAGTDGPGIGVIFL